MECDRYHKWDRHDTNWNNYTHLNPDANYITKMCDDVFDLKFGRMGHPSGNWPYYMNGKLDDIGIWNRALTPCEIQALYYAGTGVSTALNFLNDTTFACGLSANVTPNASFSSYAWSTGANSSSITVNSNGTYACTVADANGCLYTDSTYVSMLNAQIQQNEPTVCTGSTVHLNLMDSTFNNVTDTMQLYNNFIFTALDTVAGKYKIWRKPSYNSNYTPIFNDQYHRSHPIPSIDRQEIIYVRYKRNNLYPSSNPITNATMDSSWICRSNINGTNEQVLLLIPNYNRDCIFSLDWSFDKSRILINKGNDAYPNLTRDGDVFEYDILTGVLTNITNNWTLMEWNIAKYAPGSYDF